MLLIAGEWCEGPEYRDVTAPADGDIVGRITYGDHTAAVAAADAAAAATAAWADLPPRARAEYLFEAAARLKARTPEMGALLSRETGKRLPEAEAEVAFAAEYFRWFAEEARRPSGEVLAHDRAGRRQLTFHRAIGVAVVLTPWNFPVSIPARKLAPALAAGCAVVFRPSEKAPLTAVELVRCLHEANVPPGVVNLVNGPATKISEALLAHPAVRVVSFTGSTEVGRRIMELASARIVRPLLELGGDAPFVVLDDADTDAAVQGALTAKFRNNGQSCIAANRFLVHEAVFDDFTRTLAKAIDTMTIGDPAQPTTPDLGPLIDRARVDEVTQFVDEAIDTGATRLTGSRRLPDRGTFCAPSLVAGAAPDSLLATREVFGPAAGVFSFTDEDDAVRVANSTEMGLAGYVYTRDLSRAWRLAERLEVGILGINDPLPSVAYAPMGGVKQSGLGREGGRVGLEEFEEQHYVGVGL